MLRESQSQIAELIRRSGFRLTKLHANQLQVGDQPFPASTKYLPVPHSSMPSSSFIPLLCCRYMPLVSTSVIFPLRWPFSPSSNFRCFSGNATESTRKQTFIQGCDYEHWLVVMEPPKGNPLRDDIIDIYIKTLSMALGSTEEAKKSIYSVSTKYYYAFGCKLSQKFINKLNSLPNVRWVLPDSYLYASENDYGVKVFPVCFQTLDSSFVFLFWH
ncbi:PREDICTED: multiple organellar RNA editing factor 7, mitochondrial isoform X2 [Nelumbo nucifera]|uniref:Multiple organellar RNA editing factor 7, mitochondrial isoform X2 n=1 Tax=Nelumbo nucifera TaxID=4432 RepID=A0A1U8Q4Y4_NELNU|nr:PREDICTED: multiple organellar RNA editing factor 7, mitochondrial isoform X2 [Nelumbo nucifera]